MRTTSSLAMPLLLASVCALVVIGCARSRSVPEQTDADCAQYYARAMTQLIGPDGRPRCRAVFVGDTALRLGVQRPLASDSSFWQHVDDSVYAVRSPERFGAGYVRVTRSAILTPWARQPSLRAPVDPRQADGDYSVLNAAFRSTRAPRIAGITLATMATSSNAPATVPNTTGSRAR
jgi:hypothetical protein